MNVLTPRCPLCDQPPAIGSEFMTPWFCGTDDCPILSWDPTTPLDELLTNTSSVDLGDLGGAAPPP